MTRGASRCSLLFTFVGAPYRLWTPSPSRMVRTPGLLLSTRQMCMQMKDVPVEKHPARLVTASWLNAQIANEGDILDNLTVLDVRGRVEKVGGRVESGYQPVEYIADDNAFFSGHIPHARFVDWHCIDLSKHVDFCDNMSRLGVERDNTICIYDWGDMLFATRLWLALVAMGCEDVRVVNGGWAAWDAVDGPVSLETACPLASYSLFESQLDEDKRPAISVPKEEVRKFVGQKDIVFIDARSVKQFNGVERRSKRGGHIPHAVSLPYRKLLGDKGIGLRSDDNLRALFAGSTTPLWGKELQTICYCNGGVASTLILFCAIRCGAEWGAIRNYCGSFNEWGNVDDTLVEYM